MLSSKIQLRMMILTILLMLLSQARATHVHSIEQTITSVRQTRMQQIAALSHSRNLQGSSTNDTCATLIGALELSSAGATACNCSLEESTGIYSLQCNYDYCQDCSQDTGACAILTENSTYKYEDNELTYMTFNFCVEFSGSLTQTLCYSDQKDDAVCSISVGNDANKTVCNYCLFISCPEDSVLPTNFLKDFSFDCSNVVINGGPGPTVTFCKATNDDLTGVFAALATDQYTFETCFAEEAASPSLSNVSAPTVTPAGGSDGSNATSLIPTSEPVGDAPSASPDADEQRCTSFINGLSLAPAGADACTCTPKGIGKFFVVKCDYGYCQDCNSDISSCGTLIEQYVYNRNNRRISYKSCVNMTGDVQGQICYADRYDSNVCTMTVGERGRKQCTSCATNVNCTNGASIPDDFFRPFSFDCSNILPGVNVDACSSTNETLVPNTILAGLRNDVFTFPNCWGSGTPSPSPVETPAPLTPSSSPPSSTPPVDQATPSPASDQVAQVCSMLIGKLDLAPEGANACQCSATNKAQTFFAVECDFGYCPEYNQELNTSATLARRYTFNYRGRKGSFTNCVNLTGGIEDTVCYSELFKSDECVISVGAGSTSKQCTSCTNDVQCDSGPADFLAPFSFDCSNLISGLTADYCDASNSTLSGRTSLEVALRNDLFTFASCFGGGVESTPSPAPVTSWPTPMQSGFPGPTMVPESDEQVCDGLISALELPPDGSSACSCTADEAGKAFTLDCDFDYCQDCDESLGICGNLTETRVFSRNGDYIANGFCVSLSGTVEGTVCYGDSVDTSVCNITIDAGNGPVACNSCYAVQCNPGAQPPANLFKPVSFDCSNVISNLVFDYCTATDETLGTDSILVALRNDTLSFASCFEDSNPSQSSYPQSSYPQSSYPQSSYPTSSIAPSTYQPSSSSAPTPSLSSLVPTRSDVDTCKALVDEQLLPPGADGACTCEPGSSADVFVVNCNYDYCEQCVTQPKSVCGGYSESIQYTRAGKYISSGYCVDLSGDTNSKVCVSDDPEASNQCNITVTTDGIIQACNSCQYVQCNLGSTAMSIDCGNLFDGAKANFCVGSEVSALDAASPMIAFRSDLLSFNSCFSNETSKNPSPSPPPTSTPPTSLSGNTGNSGAPRPMGFKTIVWTLSFVAIVPSLMSYWL